MRYKSMYKRELADAAGVSRQTFGRWLKSDEEELRRIGVKKQAKVLPALAVKYLCEKYVIDT